MSHAEVERERIPQFQQYHRLRLALEVEDIGVQEMADYLGVERNSVSRWINGRTQPSKQTLRLWAMRTGVPLEWLETGAPPPGLEPGTYGFTVCPCHRHVYS